MSDCVAPNEIKPGDLLAYASGDASHTVRAHVARCAHCQAEAKLLARDERALLARFFRAECPASLTLVEYHHNQLAPKDKLRVAAHVRACPHCQKELSGMQAETRTWLESILGRAAAALDAVLQQPAGPVLAPVRGDRGGESIVMSFKAGELTIELAALPSADGSLELTGTIDPPGAGVGGQVWLAAPDREPLAAAIDEQGVFSFINITPAMVDLVLELGASQALVLREVRLDSAG
jgi:hypothetical protein